MCESRTICTEEVVQCDAENVDRRRKRFACPVPAVKHLSNSVPVGKVWHGSEHRREEHDVGEGDSHAAACEWVAHIPRVAEEDDALFGMSTALLDRCEERVWHAPETVLGDGGVYRRMQRRGQLRDDVCEDVVLRSTNSQPTAIRNTHARTHLEVRRDGVFDVDEDAGIVLADLV